MEYNNYFWDFDGTLFDTYGHIAESMQRAICSFGLPIGRDEVNRALKQSVPFTAQEYAPLCSEACGRKITADELLARFSAMRHEDAHAEETPYEGAVETVRALAERGARHFMVTHRGHSADAILKAVGIRTCFTEVVDTSYGFPRKPAPDAVLFLLAKYGLNPEECVMVGDRPLDIEAGRAAGIHTLLFDPEGFYPEYPADGRARSMRELW